MCATDKQSFQSIAQAQVAVANEVYEHLGMPCFLFCPTGRVLHIKLQSYTITMLQNHNIS